MTGTHQPSDSTNSSRTSLETKLFASDTKWRPVDRSAAAAQIAALPTNTLGDVAAKSRSWSDFIASPDFARERFIADAYCASVTFPRTEESASWMIAPYDAFYALRDNPDSEISDEAIERVDGQSSRYQFLHWHLAFPEVFGDAHAGTPDDRCGWTGGFDVVLGNPPWDTLSPDRKEFFKAWLPGIASRSSGDQKAAINEALAENPQMRAQWEEYRQDLFATARYFRRSGRYRMFAPGHLGKGDLNIYRAFVELALTSVKSGGVATQVTPSGIYGGANAAEIRVELFDRMDLQWLWGFINSRERHIWFPGVHRDFSFAVYIARRQTSSGSFAAGFRITSPDELTLARQFPYQYSEALVQSIDREALLVPEVQPGLDAEVMTKLLTSHKTFSQQNSERGWHPYRREIDMGTDAYLFTKDSSGLPVYEGRMVHSYDHRAKAYMSGAGRSSKWTPTLPFDSPDKRIAPQWFILAKDAPAKLEDSWRRYRIGFLDVANAKSDPRCLRAAVIPPVTICGDKVPTVSFEDGDEWRYGIWLATANSVVMDYIARRQIALKVSFTVLNGLPFPEVDPYSDLGHALIGRVLRLTCVSADMDSFRTQVLKSADLPDDHSTPPAIEDADRAQLRAEIDALVARECFDLTRDAFAHILDDFPKLRQREEEPPPGGLGEYRTKRLALEAFDSIAPLT